MTTTFYPDHKDFSFYEFRQQFGMLHDAVLAKHSYQNHHLVLEFTDLSLYEEDYINKTIFNQYKNFTRCKIDIICEKESPYIPKDNRAEMIIDSGMKIKRGTYKVRKYEGKKKYRLIPLDQIDLSGHLAEFLTAELSGDLRLNFCLLGKKGTENELILNLCPESVTFLWE